MYAHKNT